VSYSHQPEGQYCPDFSLPPFDFKHLPAEVILLTFVSSVISYFLTQTFDNLFIYRQASTVAQCHPPTPESGVELEDDDDDSEETKDVQHALEDSDIQDDEAPEEDARIRAMRRRRINEELMTTAESSPSGQDDDADETASPPLAAKSSTGFFAVEDYLDL
jgi:hypothetical protein